MFKADLVPLICRTIKRLRAGNLLLFTKQHLAEAFVAYAWMTFWRMMLENGQDIHWALQSVQDDICDRDDDQLNWLEHILLEFEEWLIPAMQQSKRAEGEIMGREQCREFIRGLSQFYIDKLKRERDWEQG